MKLNIFADISLLTKKFVKQNTENIIYVHSVDLPYEDFKPDVFRNYICDNTGHIYFTEQKVLSFHI